MTAKILQGCVLDLLPSLPRESVDCCVTSPPYWQLRSYLPKGHALKPKEMGSEKTLAEYVAGMVRVFRLVREALAPHGTVWLNVGDTYASGASGQSDLDAWAGTTRRKDAPGHRRKAAEGIDSGNLCLIPQRLAIALQDDGWLVRSVVVWHKPAPMPASLAGWRWVRCRVKAAGQKLKTDSKTHTLAAGMANGKPHTVNADWLATWADCPGCPKCEKAAGYVLRRGSWRPTSSWEPILVLAKGPGYFCDGEAVKQPPAAATVARDQYTRVAAEGTKSFVAEEGGVPSEATLGLGGEHRGPQFAVKHDHETACDSGANLRDVWRRDMSREDMLAEMAKMPEGELRDLLFPADGNPPDFMSIASEPLKERHYAAFPSELVYRCLKAGTSARGYCPACGAPWARVVEQGPSAYELMGKTGRDAVDEQAKAPGGGGNIRTTNGTVPSFLGAEASTIGWRPSCGCIGADTFTPRPALVLDCFAGSGRTGLQARRLGLDFVGCELNPEYAGMAARLLYDDAPLFAEG
jgi:DNA modification methylase